MLTRLHSTGTSPGIWTGGGPSDFRDCPALGLLWDLDFGLKLVKNRLSDIPPATLDTLIF